LASVSFRITFLSLYFFCFTSFTFKTNVFLWKKYVYKLLRTFTVKFLCITHPIGFYILKMLNIFFAIGWTCKLRPEFKKRKLNQTLKCWKFIPNALRSLIQSLRWLCAAISC
jgi:hypothetical protein